MGGTDFAIPQFLYSLNSFKCFKFHFKWGDLHFCKNFLQQWQCHTRVICMNRFLEKIQFSLLELN